MKTTNHRLCYKYIFSKVTIILSSNYRKHIHILKIIHIQYLFDSNNTNLFENSYNIYLFEGLFFLGLAIESKGHTII